MRESCRMGAMLAMADDIGNSKGNSSYSGGDGFGIFLTFCFFLLGIIVFIGFCFMKALESPIALVGAIAITATPFGILFAKIAKRIEKREQEKRRKNRHKLNTEKWNKNYDWDY